MIRPFAHAFLLAALLGSTQAMAQEPAALPPPPTPLVAPVEVPAPVASDSSASAPAVSLPTVAPAPATPAATPAPPPAGDDSKPEAATSDAPPATPAPVALQEREMAPLVPGMETFKPSYGTMGPSVFYSNSDIDAMKAVLDNVERILAVGGTPQVLDLEERDGALVQAAADAPPEVIPSLEFPAFHVASILYHGRGNWMLWINGQRVTPKRPFAGLEVTAVGPDQVSIAWKADNWKYRMQVWNDKTPPSTQIQKMKAARSAVGISVQSESLYATMRPNQTLVTATPLIVEGSHPEFSVTVQPQPKTEVAEGEVAIGEEPAVFSGKAAQDYIDQVAKDKSSQISANSKKELEKKAAPVAAAQAPVVDPAAPPSVEIPTATSTPVITPGAVPAPLTLNDILNAVKAQANPETTP